jgi:hypothetical protein
MSPVFDIVPSCITDQYYIEDPEIRQTRCLCVSWPRDGLCLGQTIQRFRNFKELADSVDGMRATLLSLYGEINNIVLLSSVR